MKTDAKHILVVEDDVAIRDILVEVLESEGHRVETAREGAEAIDCLRDGCRPNLIMLDLVMPVMDGVGFRNTQMEHAEWAKIPVLVMTADGRCKEKLRVLGLTDFIRKPMDIGTIIDAVDRCAS